MTARDQTREAISTRVAERIVAEDRAALQQEIAALDRDAGRLRTRGFPHIAADLLNIRDRLRALDDKLSRRLVISSDTKVAP